MEYAFGNYEDVILVYYFFVVVVEEQELKTMNSDHFTCLPKYILLVTLIHLEMLVW